MLALLLIAHVLCTTAGYAGLIAGNAYLLFLTGSGNAPAVRTGLGAWRKSAQTFGPLLGAGTLLGFALAATFHVSLVSPWLVATYALILAVLAIQFGVMVPWQQRSDRALASGAIPRLTPVRAVIAAQSVVYTAIVGLMLVKPG
ncbi:MAG TPA: hypothetical protein VKB39_03070 [Candidatus Baltobacteraceae bacterium]|nr:hypothetical protein [Candidatus Baltobacteraceae bacterium]